MADLVIEDGVSEADIALAKELHDGAETETSQESEVVSEDNPSNAEEEQASDHPEEEKSIEDQDESYKFTVKGEDKEFSRKDIVNILSREETFQKKFNSLSSSEEYKLGVLMNAARSGDKSAQKKVYEQLKELSEDFTELDSVEEEFDTDKAVEKTKEDSQFEEAFADVKGDVDYEDTMSKIQSDLKGKMSESVFNAYWNGAETRRVMYDLVKSGKTEEVFEALNEELSKLPLVDRVKIKKDPDTFGDLVVEVVNDLYAQPQSKKAKGQEASNLDAVSTGKSSRSNNSKDDTQIDWASLSKEEFARMEKKLLGQNF